MKEVKIYTIVSDQLSPPITGESFCTDMVRHSDYAELEAKYAALAADNDKAMESLRQANAVVKLAHEKFSALAAENETLKYQEPKLAAMMSCLDAFYADDDVPERAMMTAYNILRKSVGTPATDAFLAEVRARAIPEGYALVPQQIFLEPSELSQFARNVVTVMNPGTVILLTDCCGLATFNMTTAALFMAFISRQQITQKKAV